MLYICVPTECTFIQVVAVYESFMLLGGQWYVRGWLVAGCAVASHTATGEWYGTTE